MKIYTGNFANQKKYTNAGIFPISIALSAKYFSGISYRVLAPEWSYKNDPEDIYKPKFLAKLKQLNKESVKQELQKLSKGKDVVLLCHEKYGVFCHRHIVNSWIGGDGEFLEKEKTKTTCQIEIF